MIYFEWSTGLCRGNMTSPEKIAEDLRVEPRSPRRRRTLGISCWGGVMVCACVRYRIGARLEWCGKASTLHTL